MTAYDTDLAATFGRFERAIDAGDLDTASELAVEIERDTPDPLTALEDFRTAVAAAEDARARALLLAAKSAFGERTAERTALGLRADAVAARYDPGSTAARTLAGVSARGGEVDGALGGLFLTAGLFLNQRPEERGQGGRRDVIAEAELVIERERSYRSVASEARAALSAAETDLAPNVEIAAVRPDAESFLAGTTEELTVAVTNVGDRPATEVTVEAALVGDTGMTVEPAAESLVAILGGDTAATTFTLQSDSPGEYAIEIAVESATGGVAETRETVVVNETPPSIGAVYDRDDDRILDTDELQRAIAHYVEDEPVPETDGRVLDAEDVRELVAWWAIDAPVGGGV